MRSLFSTVSVLALLLTAASVHAQTTGKIAGTVTDAGTGEPLPGVNVLIDGTTQGTATDINGEYVIIGVRPGSYSVVASFIGFATERREGVSVSVDLTTTIDFQLREEVFEGEEIVVTADAVTVKKDLTSSEARVTSETLDRLPVQEIGQVLNVQAGITNRGGGLHIRGGRSSEVVYMVDGVPVTDGFDGSLALQVENDGIEELQVISGTFNAEYGNAMSGVINVVTKEGRSDRFGGSVEAYTGSYVVAGDGGAAYLRGTDVAEFSAGGIQYREADPYGYLDFNPTQYYNLNLSLEGPIVGDRLTVFALGRYFKNDGWLYGTRLYEIDGQPGDSALVPMNNFEKYSGQANLRYRLNDKMIINLTGLGSYAYSRPYDFFRRQAPDGRQKNYDFGYDTKLKFTHLVSATTFYTIDIASFYRQAEARLFDSIIDARYNGFNLNPPPFVVITDDQGNPTTDTLLVLTGGGRFAQGGTDLGRFERSTRTYFLKSDLTSQVTNNHLVKIGLTAKLEQLAFDGFGLTDANDAADVFEPEAPEIASLARQQFDDVEPITISAYIQDKIEYESFIVNVGLRADYFAARAQVPADPQDPNIFAPFKKINRFRDVDGSGVIEPNEETDENRLTVADREAYWYRDVDPKFQLSPRLGVAYPITEAGVIHFSYGHFLQIPTLNRLFENFGYKLRTNSGQYGPFGNPDLEAQKTIMYEIGFKQGIGEFVFDVTGYYRDVRNWVSTSRLITTEQPGVNYVVYANRDYANTRGITISARRAYSDGYGFDLNYTFQIAEGSNSDPAAEFFASQAGNEPTLTLLPLNWDQRHKIAGSVYFGGANWGGSLLGVFGSGFPYTPSFPQAAIQGQDVQSELPTNSRRIPSSFQLDGNVYYIFDFGLVRPRLFAQVYNLLDERVVQDVFSDTGLPDVTFTRPDEANFDAGFYVRPDFYAEPRRVQVGIQFSF